MADKSAFEQHVGPIVLVGSSLHPKAVDAVSQMIFDTDRLYRNLEAHRPSERFMQFKNEADKWYLERLKNDYGIAKKNVSSVRDLWVVSRKKMDSIGQEDVSALEHFGVIVLVDEGIPNDLQIVDWAFSYMHEREHAAGKNRISQRGTYAHFDRQGLKYRGGNESHMLEEGMARLVELDSRPLVEKYFPKELARSNALKKQKGKDSYPQWVLEKYISILQLTKNTNTGQIELGGDPLSLVLIQAIDQDMPDFIYLAERARVLGETLTLARAVESVYGKGSYVWFTKVTEQDVLEFWNKGKERDKDQRLRQRFEYISQKMHTNLKRTKPIR